MPMPHPRPSLPRRRAAGCGLRAQMKIAVIGAGVAGLVSALVLSRQHDVQVFEAAPRPGGHTYTVELQHAGRRHPVDMGFIVFNRPNYPGFAKILDGLGVGAQATDRSFGVQCARTGLEYGGSSIGAFFAQRARLLAPRHWRLLREILRFHREAPAVLDRPEGLETLRTFLEEGRYSQALQEHYIVPMAAALWSGDPGAILEFPAHYFVQFFENHGFFKLRGRPEWLTVQGGSQSYVEKLCAKLPRAIRTSCPVLSVRRTQEAAFVHTRAHGEEAFDAVVLALHSDRALRILRDPSAAEQEVLGAIRTQPNEVVLHSDARVMPRQRRAWSSWNYHVPSQAGGRATVTYHMNRLQRLPEDPAVFVTLNRSEAIDPSLVHHRITFHHPIYTPQARRAQQRWGEINGVRRTWYAGAWWGWGFHEDGVQSALRVCREFGLEL